MVLIIGYKQVSYKEFIKLLSGKFEATGKTALKLAGELKFKSVNSIFNCMRLDQQKVSDEKLTTFAKHINMDCCILITGGEKFFYIKQVL